MTVAENADCSFRGTKKRSPSVFTVPIPAIGTINSRHLRRRTGLSTFASGF